MEPRRAPRTVVDLIHTGMTKKRAAPRAVFLMIPPLLALVGVIAFVAVHLGPAGLSALTPLLLSGSGLLAGGYGVRRFLVHRRRQALAETAQS